MPMPLWFVPVLIMLAILSFLITPPTFLVNWFTSRFMTHARLSSRDTIYLSGSKLDGPDKERFIKSWNDAEFLYETEERPTNVTIDYSVEIVRGRREYRFLLHLFDTYIDVFRNTPKQRKVAYRVVAPNLTDCITDLCPHDVAATGY